jgi:hypothetical protein
MIHTYIHDYDHWIRISMSLGISMIVTLSLELSHSYEVANTIILLD